MGFIEVNPCKYCGQGVTQIRSPKAVTIHCLDPSKCKHKSIARAKNITETAKMWNALHTKTWMEKLSEKTP